MKNLDKLRLRDLPGGVVIAIKAVPASSRDRIVGVLGDCLKITTSSPAEKGKANATIAETLAEALGIDRRSVTLHSGGTNPRKEFLVVGLSAQEIKSRLSRAPFV